MDAARSWDKKFRKRNISILLCMGLFAGCLSGCGGKYAGVAGEDAVSGGAVSGSAVSGDAISGSAISDKDMDGKAVSGSAIGKEQAGDGSGEKEEQDMSGHRFCTDTNLYYEENEAVMQMRLDGTHKTCLRVPDNGYGNGYLQVCYVDENWLYYANRDCIVEDEDTEDSILYRAPIRKDADGYDVVSISEEKKVVTDASSSMLSTYVDSRYLFYMKDYDEIVKYDLQKRREVSTKEITGYSMEVFQVNNHYIAAVDFGNILVQDINAKQWTRVSGFVTDYDRVDDYVTQNEQAVFYPQDLNEDDYDDRRFRIRRYDGEKETDFLTWEQIEKTVLEAESLGPGELDFAGPDHLFWQGDRLYIQVQVGWEKEGIYHEEFVILSRGEREDASGLRYERKLTECMRSHVKSRKGKWVEMMYQPRTVLVDQMVVNSAYCIAMVNGKAYLKLHDHEKDKGRLGCYELNTGEFQWVEREDLLFYEIGYDYNLSEFEGVYNKMNSEDPYMDDYDAFEPHWRDPSIVEGGHFEGN